MRPVRALVLPALVACAACSGGGDAPSGPTPTPTESYLPVVNRLDEMTAALRRAGLTSAANQVAFAAAGLTLGVRPTTVNVTTSLARQAPNGGTAGGASAALAGGAGAAVSMQAAAFQVVLRNFPGEGDIVMDGGVAWTPDLSQVVVVSGAGPDRDFAGWMSLTKYAMGTLMGSSPSAIWLARAGTMTVAGGSTTSGPACPGGRADQPCRLAGFTLGFDVVEAHPFATQGSTATGNRTATLAPTAVNGYTIVLDYTSLAGTRITRPTGQRVLEAALGRMMR